jgi:Fe-S cluster assembly protein SufB
MSEQIHSLLKQDYQAGFVTSIESDTLPPGLSEDVVRLISAKKGEPEWMLAWRLKAYAAWVSMKQPGWAHVSFPPIDFDEVSYYSVPKSMADGPKSLEDVDPELLRTYEKLGIPLHERAMLAGVAVDAVFDSVSVVTTFKEKLHEAGVIFCPISEAVHEYPELVQKYLGSVVPATRQLLRGAELRGVQRWILRLHPERGALPDGAVDLFPYQRGEDRAVRAHADHCRRRQSRQLPGRLHRADARREPAACGGGGTGGAEGRADQVLDGAELVPGRREGKGGIYNFVTKRGVCHDNAKISWTQVETGSAITWKYPSVVLQGRQLRR